MIGLVDAMRAMSIVDSSPRANEEIRQIFALWRPPDKLYSDDIFLQGALSGMMLAQFLVTRNSDDPTIPTKEGLEEVLGIITELSRLYLQQIEADMQK